MNAPTPDAEVVRYRLAAVAATREALRREIGPPTERDDQWQPMVSAGEVRQLLDALDDADRLAHGAPCSWHRVSAECAVELTAALSVTAPDAGCHCPPCPGRGNDGHGMTHCAECCFGSGVEADPDCPTHGAAPDAGQRDTQEPTTARAEAVLDFVEYIATQAAYNGAGDPGQKHYDHGLNPWLSAQALAYLTARADREAQP